MNNNIIALRMQRQSLCAPISQAHYDALYRDLQPGYNVYWNGFGNPPSLSFRADFDDMEYNRTRQETRALIKLRLVGGNLGWIAPQDLALFSALYRKPLTKPTSRQLALLELIERQGPLTIAQMKEETGMLVKEITPALHRLQEAFLVYEDQNEGQNDRAWYAFGEMFPDADLAAFTRQQALQTALQRVCFRMVWLSAEMAKNYLKLPAKEIALALEALVAEGVLLAQDGGFLLACDAPLLQKALTPPPKCVFALHRNDILVRCDEPALKAAYPHDYPDTLYYLLIDGRWQGAVVGKFRYTPEVSDVLLDLPEAEAEQRKEEIIAAILAISKGVPPAKFCGEALR